MVASATGFNEQRGDVINVSAVEFIDGLDGVEIDMPGFFDSLGAQTGTMINALAFVVVAFLVAWFGLRPMVGGAGQAGRARPARAELRGRAALAADAGPGGHGDHRRSERALTAGPAPGKRQRARRSAPEDQAGAAGTAGPHGRPQ